MAAPPSSPLQLALSSQARRPSRGAARAGLFVAAACLAWAGCAPRAFLAPSPGTPAAASGGVLAARSAAERLDTPRGEAPLRTQMYGRYPDRTRLKGGGRLKLPITRNPVMAYSDTAEGDTEPAVSVINRMWGMYEQEYHQMMEKKWYHFVPPPRRRELEEDFYFRLGRKKSLRRKKEKGNEEWMLWLRTKGRKEGLAEPVVFSGPKLKDYVDNEDKAKDLKALLPGLNKIPPMQASLRGKKYCIPEDMKPGKWQDDAPTNPFKVWTRPLAKNPYDLARLYKPAVRGII